VTWSRTRKRYERQGILIEEAALDAAEQACLADEDARMRRRERDRERRALADVELQARMAGEITRLFPRCPPERAEAVARHTAPPSAESSPPGPKPSHSGRRHTSWW
jgi:hypothetical protein